MNKLTINAKPSRASKEARFMVRLFVDLIIGIGIILVFIVLLATFFYFIEGMNSVMIYEPPIGPLLSFVYNVVEVAGVAIAAIFGLAVFLHQIPKLREQLDNYVEPREKKTVGDAS
jgi:uncharacterized RDD family membrane protein YckC